MSLVADTYTQNREQFIKEQWQPDFPLKYSNIYGPYEPINTLRESLQKDFENLLLTCPGEWPGDPDLGIGLRRYLFENFDSPVLNELRPRMQSQLDKYLPHISLLSVDFESTDKDKDENFSTIRIRYSIMGLNIIELMASIMPGGYIRASQKTIEEIVSFNDAFGPSTRLGSNTTII